MQGGGSPQEAAPQPKAAIAGGLSWPGHDVLPDGTRLPDRRGLTVPDVAGEIKSVLGPDGNAIPRFLIPHIETFTGIVGGLSTYRWRYDEALRHSRENALAMRRDTFIAACLEERYLAASQLNWDIVPDNASDPAQMEVANAIKQRVLLIPDFEGLRSACLESVWYGRAAAHQLWDYDADLPGRPMRVVDHYPINGDKLVYAYDGTPGILVHATAPLPADADVQYTERNRALMLSTAWYRERFLIATHKKIDADFYEPDLAGMRFGVGCRNFVYWYWWLLQEVMGWIVDYVEKVGLGVTVFYYEQGNKEAEAKAKEAAKQQSRNTVIVLPRPIGQEKAGSAIERLEVPVSGAEFLLKIVETYFKDAIRQYINGQTLSAAAESTGLGSGVAQLHSQTKAAITLSDSKRLDEVLTRDLIRVDQKWNHPKARGFRCRFQSTINRPDSDRALAAARAIFDMGGEIDQSELLSIANLTQPTPDGKTLKRMDPTVNVDLYNKMEAEQQAQQQREEAIAQQMAQGGGGGPGGPGSQHGGPGGGSGPPGGGGGGGSSASHGHQTPYSGPRGGHGRRDLRTGKVVYDRALKHGTLGELVADLKNQYGYRQSYRREGEVEQYRATEGPRGTVAGLSGGHGESGNFNPGGHNAVRVEPLQPPPMTEGGVRKSPKSHWNEFIAPEGNEDFASILEKPESVHSDAVGNWLHVSHPAFLRGLRAQQFHLSEGLKDSLGETDTSSGKLSNRNVLGTAKRALETAAAKIWMHHGVPEDKDKAYEIIRKHLTTDIPGGGDEGKALFGQRYARAWDHLTAEAAIRQHTHDLPDDVPDEIRHDIAVERGVDTTGHPLNPGTGKAPVGYAKADGHPHTGKYTVKMVDAEKLRGHSLDAQEFGDVGTHCLFSFIPKDEIWLADNVTEEEKHFLLDNAVTQLESMATGDSSDKAYDKGLAVEAAERERHKNAGGGQREYEPGQVDKTLYMTFADATGEVNVYLVNGEEVRDRFKTDFIEGGHGYVYPWVPRDEIWLEAGERADEYPVLLLHERVERDLMRGGMGYGEAHKKASAAEFAHRHAPKEGRSGQAVQMAAAHGPGNYGGVAVGTPQRGLLTNPVEAIHATDEAPSVQPAAGRLTEPGIGSPSGSGVPVIKPWAPVSHVGTSVHTPGTPASWEGPLPEGAGLEGWNWQKRAGASLNPTFNLRHPSGATLFAKTPGSADFPNELAAHAIHRLLGVPNTPTTAKITHPEHGDALVMHQIKPWIEGAAGPSRLYEFEGGDLEALKAANPANLLARQKLANHIMNLGDLHGGNYVVGEGGRLAKIDNGFMGSGGLPELRRRLDHLQGLLDNYRERPATVSDLWGEKHDELDKLLPGHTPIDEADLRHALSVRPQIEKEYEKLGAARKKKPPKGLWASILGDPSDVAVGSEGSSQASR